MVLNSTQFEIVVFFSLGFLCLVGFLGLFLSFLFKSRIFYYYCGYILSVLIFIACVYVKAASWIPSPSPMHKLFELIIDVVQMIGNFLFGAFIYQALLREDLKFKKLNIMFRIYTGFIVLYVLSVIVFPLFVLKSIPYFIASRLVVVFFSLFFYYHIIKELKNTYFLFLFLATSFLLLSGFFAFWDSVFNYNSGAFVGFQYLCYGYVLENICFTCAFIYKYFSTTKQKLEGEIKHELQLSSVQLEMQYQTMQHIGREIHDNVGQKLTLASLYIQQLGYENKAPLAQNTIENISDIINQSLNELRQMSKSLTSNTIEHTALQELLRVECERFDGLKNCKISFDVLSKSPILAYQTKCVLLRVTQEFMQNSIKHSQCSNINITLSNTIKKLSLCLEDNGKGFDIKKKGSNGIGLSNMKKRIEIIGGSYSLESDINMGTKLTLEIPL